MIEALVEEYQNIDELFWKVKLPDLPAVIVDSDSQMEIKRGLRKTLKPDSFKEISIERVTKSEKRKMHLKLAKGMEDEEEPVEEAKDVGMECQECGKRFRSKNPKYGSTKCPKCKSTDIDLAYGDKKESVEEDAKMGKQSDDQLRKLYQKASAMDQSSPANKSFTQRIGKEMKKRGISEDAPTNSIGDGKCAIAIPPEAVKVRRRKKKYEEFVVSDDVYHKFRNGKMKFERWSKYLNLENEAEKNIYNYARSNHRGICVLRHEDTGQVRAIRYSRTGGGNWGTIQRVREEVLKRTNEFTRLQEETFDIINNIAKKGQSQKVKIEGKTVYIDKDSANAMMKVYEGLSKDNQQKFKDTINKNMKGFEAMREFASKQKFKFAIKN